MSRDKNIDDDFMNVLTEYLVDNYDLNDELVDYIDDRLHYGTNYITNFLGVSRSFLEEDEEEFSRDFIEEFDDLEDQILDLLQSLNEDIADDDEIFDGEYLDESIMHHSYSKECSKLVEMLDRVEELVDNRYN